jgi:hypothetical protein
VLRLPLLGLEATLFREDCEQLVLSGPNTPQGETLVHEGEDVWRRSSTVDHVCSDEDIRGIVGTGLASPGDTLVCMLPNERIEYRVVRKGVQIRRSPLISPNDVQEDLGPISDRLLTAFGGVGAHRKDKLRQAAYFGKTVLTALARHENRDLRILDAACGRSYLGLMLTLLLRSKGWQVRLQGIDYSEALVTKARTIAASLAIHEATFVVADLGSFSARETPPDMVVSLHGCDTLSDDAIRLAVESGARYAFIAPCCQHELRHELKEHPLTWISRYGLLEQRLADVLTDGLRCLVLEAFGYKVNVIRFADLDVTPKNLLIQAVRTAMPQGRNAQRAREARAFAATFGVQTAALHLLDRIPPVQ